MLFFSRGKGIIPRSRWRRSALVFAAAALLTFIINLSFVIWATTHSSDDPSGVVRPGIGIIASGECQRIKSWNTGAHVAINIISTVLLAGSNYCMQCLIAPTRKEIDAAHAENDWLDVGIPSIRNFWRIAWKRKIVWSLLAMSSFPLHLLFNSVVFTSTSTNLYNVYAVSVKNFDEDDMSLAPGFLPSHLYPRIYTDTTQFVYLDTRKCLDEYGTAFQSSRGDLVVVVDNGTAFHGVARLGLDYGEVEHPFDWICGDSQRQWTRPSCDEKLSKIKSDATWTVGTNKVVKGCYSEKTDEHCKLLFSSVLCWTVTALNVIKGLLMLFVAYGNTERPVLTIGDAIVSFLKDGDGHTKAMALSTKSSLRKLGWSCDPQEFHSTRRRKFAAGSLLRWMTTIALWFLAILVCTSLLIIGLRANEYQVGDSDIKKYGLGKAHGDTILDIGTLSYQSETLITNVLVANTPQVIMSMIYFSYNAIFTSLSLITEWDRLGTELKGLRVSSHCQGDQRQTYFLQLPYRYSLPLTIFSGGLHWLISQSIFLVNIETWPPGRTSYGNIMSCGWSPIGIICVIVAGTIMVVFLLASGFRRLRYGVIPVAGSCSAAISAACHPALNEEPEMWTKSLRWGVVSKGSSEAGSELPHCSFSSRKIGAPIEGERYR
ncbi:hypothetical protein CPAR01_04791 [Colletotrichum paranaense]|uniref:DUF6536 domain-containing protein n=1 Tax=Colletotrichum paranaense TaxID=1914294 RepID=A0ABQ9SXB0_9PEZI|nr:uncharacterized protein CPAR01_04791 [Colletotrichum paranaense]KAK1544158.1 hypothetical protein CPAR01_04791 [Colletotrichum paranaense]